jgi:PAS domain S-box-containing protein
MDETALSRRRADHQQLQQLIAGLTEGVILIDPDQSIAWANPCALAMHGVAEIAELGRDVADYRRRFELRYRNNHRLAEGAYPMERVLAGEAFDEVIVEVAPAGAEEPRWTHRIRSLVLTDRDGNPDCLALVLGDETERYDAEARFETTFAANPAPAVILRLEDRRYVKVNQGFLEMTGFPAERIVGRSAHDLDILEGAERRDLAIERLQEGRTIPQMEAALRTADGTEKLVLVAGQPIEFGAAACMLFSFADLEPRKRAETALRQSEERFAKAFRLAPVPMAIASLGRDGARFVLVNDSFGATTGHAEAEIVGRTGAEVGLWESEAARRDFDRQLAATGSIRDIAARFATREGGVLDCLVSAETVSINDLPHMLLSFLDVTARRRTEAEIVGAIEAVMHDTSWFSRVALEKLARLRRMDEGGGAAGVALAELTPRAREVLGLVCQGLDDATIAGRLGLSRTTVRNHVNALYARTEVHSRAALVVWARERGVTGEEAPAKPAKRPKTR